MDTKSDIYISVKMLAAYISGFSLAFVPSDIAHKYPELGLCIFDIEEEEEDKNTEHHYREERVRSGTRRSRHILRLSVTMPSWDRVEERGRNSVRKIYHSPTTSSSPSHTSAEYMGIVRNSLSRYLNN